MDERFTRRGILNMLESEYKDEACQQLARILRRLPSQDAAVLLQGIGVVQKAQPTLLSHDDWSRALALYDLELSKCVHQIVLSILLRELGQISGHVRYWKQSLKSPVVNFIQNGRIDWLRFRPKLVGWGLQPWLAYIAFQQRLDVHEKLDRLAQCEESFASQIGHLHHWLGAMEKITSCRGLVRQFHGFVAKLCEFVSGVPLQGRDTNDPVQLLLTLEDTLLALPEFEAWFLNHLETYRKPSHLRRYWLAYSVGAVGAAVLARHLYVQRDAVLALVDKSRESVSRALRRHVWTPLRSLYEHLFVAYDRTVRTFSERDVVVSADSLKANKKALSSALYEIGARHAATNAKDEGKTADEYMKELPTRCEQGDMSVLPRRRPWFDGAKLDHARIMKSVVDAESSAVMVDRVLRANELSVGLLTLVPAALLTGWAVWSVKCWLLGQRARADLRAHVRRHLRRIEELLIAAFGKQGLDDRATGFLLLHVHRLHTLLQAAAVGKQQWRAFERDLHHLKSLDFDVHQKHTIVSRLFRCDLLE